MEVRMTTRTVRATPFRGARQGLTIGAVKQRTASRLAWSLWALGVLVSLAGMVEVALRGGPRQVFENAAFLLVFAAMATLGAMAVSRGQGGAAGWLFLSAGLCAGVAFGATGYALSATRFDLPGVPYVAWLADWFWIGVLALPFVFLPLVFPDGHLPSRRWRPYAWLAVGFTAFAALIFALDPGSVGPRGIANPFGVEAVRPIVRFLDGPGYAGLLLLGLVSLGSLVVRYRRASSGERQQIKWFAFGAGLLALYFLVDVLLSLLAIRRGFILGSILPIVGFLALPVGAGIGILRYGLYEIDVVINRTVLFGLLAAFITAIYVGIVVGVGALVGTRGNVSLSILATAIIAVLFQPFRIRARHLANRLVYGKRATPYELLSDFADRLGGSYSTEDIPPRMARLIGEGTGSVRATVWLRVGNELRPEAAWPAADALGQPLVLAGEELPTFPSGEHAFAVRDRGEILGALSFVLRPGETLTPTQERLLGDLAGQAGLILRNVRLIEELRASRQRLVAAQDEERRRLERNIHDGAQQQLVALAVKLRLVETMAGKDPARAEGMAAQAKAELQDALENLRDLARGIYPPLLADKGLAAALESQARKAALHVEVESDGVGRFGQDVEAGVYFCVLEALQNASKHSGASRVTIRLARDDGQLVFEVADDGRGFDRREAVAGSGLQSMVDRVEVLGGRLEVESTPGRGTTVTGRLPVSP
jgi:signal transduction histidine kinase